MEKINAAIREHEISVQWEHQPLAREMHRWFDIFNAEFFEGALPTPFLQFERARQSNLGHYRPGRNAVGAQHEINLNALHLDQPLPEILGTLLHEIVHQWQEIHGKPGKGGYHNQQFTEKCAALGIPCTGGYNSYGLGYTKPFVLLLREHGVQAEIVLPSILSEPPAAVRGASKMKKWRCGCTNIRAAVVISAKCLKCDTVFTRSD